MRLKRSILKALVIALLVPAAALAAGGVRDELLNGVADGSIEAVKRLLDEDSADINLYSEKADKPTPLILAVKLEKLEMIEYLISRGADIRAVDGNGYTPLIAAMVAKKDDALGVLFDKGYTSGELAKAFMAALKNRRVGAAETFLANSGVAEKVKGEKLLYFHALVTPFAYQSIDFQTGIESPTVSLLKLLLGNGFDLAARDGAGKTALDLAIAFKDVNALKILDPEGIHNEIVAFFSNPGDSPFLGSWDNNKEGYKRTMIRFNGDGTGFSDPGRAFYWHQEGARVEVLVSAASSKLDEELTFFYEPVTDTLRVVNDQPLTRKITIFRRRSEGGGK